MGAFDENADAGIITLALLGGTFPQTAYPQDVTGDWQGTLKAPKETRLILRISKQLDGGLQARLLAADQNPADWGSGNLASSVSLEGADFKPWPRRVIAYT